MAYVSRSRVNGKRFDVSLLIFLGAVTCSLIIGYLLGMHRSDRRSASLDNKLTLDRKCTAEESLLQSQFVDAARARGCPAKDSPAIRIVQLHLQQSAKIFFDFGSNKGYAAMEFFELFTPELGLTRKGLKAVYSDSAFPATLKGENTYIYECGGCNECRSETVPLVTSGILRACTDKASETTSSKSQAQLLTASVDKLCSKLVETFKPIRVYSFEANPDLAEALKAGIEHLSKQMPPTPTDIQSYRFLDLSKYISSLDRYWTVENVVLTSHEHAGTPIKVTLNEGELGRVELVPYPAKRVDDERSATFWVKTSANAKMTEKGIPSTTVDDILIKMLKKDEFADIVKVDVEGHDFDVVMGALRSMEKHKIKVLKFEYGALWTKPLGDLIPKLDALDYACYFEGKNGMLKLTGGCWSEQLETKFWSNVWCFSLLHRESIAIANAFDGMTVVFWSR